MGRTANISSSTVRPAESSEERHLFEDQTLTGRIVLDNNSFDRCRFREATLVYTGGAPPQIRDCAFSGVSFAFEGAAGRTLALLKAMSAQTSGLREVFKASFPSLFAH